MALLSIPAIWSLVMPDGVIIVPAADVQVAIQGAQAKVDAENIRMQAIKDAPLDGISAPWLIPTLIKYGVLNEGDEI